jgi:hypothetical protein
MLVGSSPGWLGLTVAVQLCVNEQLIESQPTVREAFHSTLDEAQIPFILNIQLPFVEILF